ncbi:MAG: endonuclease/exonuclease/phosphatase family protein, partial [Bacteroidaceae bacterium]|nr:endonuclease/exonuclease/phosphatase family protein [Bacteroidaceae bacterium]
MRNIPLSLLLLLLLFTNCTAQNAKRELYGVGFYNLENLFDTIHDDSKNDYEFLPEGKYKWGTLKYTNKVRNIATVLNDLGTDVLPMGMAVVGVCEVENSRVLKDVVRHEILAPRGWKFIHIEGEDKRGIDCALLYNPELFR